MRWFSLVCLFLMFGMFMCGCAEDRSSPVAPTTEVPAADLYAPENMAALLVGQAEWTDIGTGTESLALPLGNHGNGIVSGFQREVIVGDIAHYSAVVRVGPGPYDKIGIHRVVRERRPNRPIHTSQALFLLHGDLKRFETMFIPGQFSSHLPSDFGIAVYLAQNGVDVWGMDQSWNFVPAQETNFSFFADWGIQREVDHLATGLAVARIARWLTGDHLDKMLLLGYSSGSVTGYALLNQEAQRPEPLRQVKGFISADCGVRSNDPIWVESWVGFLAYYQSIYDSGQYQDPLYLRDVAILARENPSGDSPYIPGLTNLQCALYFGGGQTFGTSAAHYHAPILEDGLPVDLQFVTIDQWLDFLENTVPYEPILFELQYSELFAGIDSPFVSHLSQVTVPVLDIGGAGGIAPYTAATVGYLGSTDVTQLYVSVGATDPLLDYGHIDIFTASNSPELIWQPMLQWVMEHSSSGLAAPEGIAVSQ